MVVRGNGWEIRISLHLCDTNLEIPYLSYQALQAYHVCYRACGMYAGLDQLSSKGLDRLMPRNLEDVSPAEKVGQRCSCRKWAEGQSRSG